MATVTGLTAERMLEIEAQTVVSGAIVGDHLILEKFDESTVDCGALPPGPTGPPGPAGGMINGEIRMWPGTTLPDEGTYGKWVWCNGAIYVIATYPEAAAAIDNAWDTFGGASAPGAGNFRVPDMRGLIPVGLDKMPGDAVRADRVTRAVAITIAGKTGEEVHVITVGELAQHSHGVTDPGHVHTSDTYPNSGSLAAQANRGAGTPATLSDINSATTGITIQNAGSNNAHENMQPSVFVPYMIKLDD